MSNSIPSFAIDAELMLKSHNFDIAINLCKDGVASYPLYLSGWIILINSYKSAGQIDEAIRATESAMKLFPENDKLNSLKMEFESVFYKVAYNNLPNNEVDFEDEKLNFENLPEQEIAAEVVLGNNLEDLAKKLAEVSEPAKESDFYKENNNPYPSGIISETIAKIYISQGAFPEAISAYRNLITINPDRQNYYLEKISELESKI